VIIGTSVLGAAGMAKGGLTAILGSFLVVVILGYIIMVYQNLLLLLAFISTFIRY
jgi:hypothetical protein